MVKKDEGKARADNWLDLANHFQIKVNKRTAEVSFLHTRSGFLIAAGVLVVQNAASGKFNYQLEYVAQVLAILIGLASLILAIVSMHMNKAAVPLKPDEMIKTLAEKPNLPRETFGKWLAESYALANKEFNVQYNRKYKQQVTAAILLVTALVITIILKGVHTYVG